MPNVSSFGTQTDNAIISGTVTDRRMVIPEVPPQGLMSVGPRQSPNYIKEPWNAQTSYVFYDVVKDGAGASYVATKPVVPAGTELTDEEFWFKWSDPDAQLNELQEIVKTYNARIAQNASAITAEVARATAAEDSKAPTNHASEETVYGVGNAVNYGHVKLADEDSPMTSDANAGIAATPKTVNDVKEAIDVKLNKIGTAVDSNGNAITKVLLIGDSYCDPAYPYYAFIKNTWWYKICTNLAKSGAGFSNQDNSFLMQLQKAPQESYSHVIVFGGNNDYTASQGQFHQYKSALYTAMLNFIKAAKEKFPNAQVIIAGPNMDPGETKSYAPENWKFLLQSAITDTPSCNTQYVDFPAGVAQSYFANFTSTSNFHPSASSAFHYWMTNFFNNVFAGGSRLDANFPINIPTSNTSVVTTTVHCSGHVFKMADATVSNLKSPINIYSSFTYQQPDTSPTLNKGFYAHVYKIESNNACKNIGLVFINNRPGVCKATYNISEQMTTTDSYLIVL